MMAERHARSRGVHYVFTMDTPPILTRKQLYDLVWSRPISSLARELKVSDVALAKCCRRENVPIPARGHWAKVAAGQKPIRPALPQRNAWEAEVDLPAPGVALKAHKPSTAMTISRARGEPRHPVVLALEKLLAKQFGDAGMFAIRGDGHSVVRCSKDGRARALEIVDTLARSFARRGHVIRVSDHKRYGSDRHALEVVVGEDAVEIWLHERVKQTPHIKTAAEIERKKELNYDFSPTYDYEPSGEMAIEAKVPWGVNVRHRWADSAKRTLESQLDDVIVNVEAIGALWAADKEQRKLARAAEALRAQERARAQQLVEHRRALAEDLNRMVNAWRQAVDARFFLAAVRERLSTSELSAKTARWLTWAEAHVSELDPLTQFDGVPKETTPDGDS